MPRLPFSHLANEMTTKDVPIIPTIIVAAAIATMIALGFWQLDRKNEKEQLIALSAAAMETGEPRPFPADDGGAFAGSLYHPTAFECTEVLSQTAVAGRNEQGHSGFAQTARCQTGRGEAEVKLGWSQQPQPPEFVGGVVVGLIVPGGVDGARVQAIPPLAGLAPLAKPDPRDLPNNHLAYAGQWFFFALPALVIYILALRRRGRDAKAG